MQHTLPKIYQSNSHPFRSGYRTTKIKETPTGFIINRFSNYISLQHIKVVYNENGFAKATVKVDTNYRTPYKHTLYFDAQGNEIKADTDAIEKKIWLDMQK